MAKIALNKNALHKEREQLRLYQSMLPSLDLKRRQLTVELEKEKKKFAEYQQQREQFLQQTAEKLPMLAYLQIDVSKIVEKSEVKIEIENVVGVKLPFAKEFHYKIKEYSRLAKPHWVDVFVNKLCQMVEIQEKINISQQRMDILQKAVRRTTQRVNLFEKILIPSSKKNIKKIRIFLSENEIAAIVRSKIVKSRHRLQREEPGEE